MAVTVYITPMSVVAAIPIVIMFYITQVSAF